MNLVSPESVGMSSSRLQRLDAAMQRYIERRQAAGLTTVLLRRGQIAHRGCYGWLNLAAQTPMREDAIFRIFSMTKPIVSLALLMLYEEGHFHLGYPISLFIPALGDMKVFVRQGEAGLEVAPLERPITIYDLLTHTSGLGYGLDPITPVEALYMGEKLMRTDESMAEKIPRIAQIPLNHQPGLRYTYSMGIDVLGHLIELISGLALDEFLHRRIFEPLGMVDTGFYVPAGKRARLASLYTSDPQSGLVDMAALDPAQITHFLKEGWVHKEDAPRFLSGGGGLVSTSADYLRFARLLRSHGELDGVRLVSRKTVELMTSVHLRDDKFWAPGYGFGLGVTVMTDPARAQMLGSAGAYGGGGAASTEFWVDPREDLIGVLMVQYASETPLPLGMDFKLLALQAIAD